MPFLKPSSFMRFIPVVIFTFAACLLSGQQLPKLVDGTHIHVSGVLAIEQRGNRQFLMIKTKEPYLAVFDVGESKQVQELGVGIEGRQAELKALAGKRVVVSGKLQLESSSPYYFNGVLVLADSVQVEGGPLLLAKQEAPVAPLPNDLKGYHAQVVFSSKSDRFAVKAWSIDGKPLALGPTYLSCGLNGPGDVMNCNCADGFKAIAKGKISGGSFVQTETIPNNFSFAQYGLPDPAKRDVARAVLCVRQ